MKSRLCSVILTLALLCAGMTLPASAAGGPVVACQMAPDGLSAYLTLEGSNLSVYGVQLTLNAGSAGLDYNFAPDANDPGLASQASIQTGGAGDTVTLYLASPYSLGQGDSIPVGRLSANERLTLSTQGTLILLDAQLTRHTYTVNLRMEGGQTATPTPTPAPTSAPAPAPDDSYSSSDSKKSDTTKPLNLSAGTNGLATLTQNALKEANSLTVKGAAVLNFDAAALKTLQNAGGTISVGAAVRTEMNRALTAQMNGATVYDLTLATGGAPINLGGGSMSVSVPFAGSGTPVAYAVGEGGQLTKLGAVKLEQGNAVFSLTGSIPNAVTVLDVTRVFPDVNGWYDGYVNAVASSGIMKGMEDGRFQPDKTMTRAELVTTLYRMSGDSVAANTQYQDVAPGDWFADAVAWANSSGVATGLSQSAFGPNQIATREQMAVMLSRFLTAKNISLSQEVPSEQFSDKAEISTFAVDAVELMQRGGILSGKGAGRFDPKGTATRAECAKMLAILLDMMK